MIGFLDGVVAGIAENRCWLDVSGVGYELRCSGATLASLPGEGRPCRLWTHLHVRDDALSLYGFGTRDEQDMFEALLQVAGIGPKVALALCSAFTPDAFRRILASDDAAAVAEVPGVGKKTAQRVVIDLKEKLSVPDLEIVGGSRDSFTRARSALENLGYSAGEARAALAECGLETGSVEELVRAALGVLAAEVAR